MPRSPRLIAAVSPVSGWGFLSNTMCSLFLLLLITLYGTFAAPTRAGPLRLELLRLTPVPSSSSSPSRLDYLRGLVSSDRLRHQIIASKIGRLRDTGEPAAPAPAPGPVPESAFAMPLTSGAYTGTGQYFVRFRVGTPAQPFLLVADTGSDLTWVKCRLPHRDGGGGGGNVLGKRVFRPEASSSWDPIRCSSEMCKASLPFSLARCSTPASPCAYNYWYSDSSTARGVFGTESATLTLSAGGKAKLRGLVLGCTTSSTGSSFRASDGVLSLGYSNISFAFGAAARFGGRFSYCLVDHLSPRNASSFLTFGPNAALSRLPRARVTRLLLEPRLQPFYAVPVSTISVDGEALLIPPSVWDVKTGGGTILDSGTSLTVLAEPAYRAVASALSHRLTGVPRVNLDPFEYCYNWTAAGGVAVPKLAVHFAGAARLEPPAKSYLIDAAEGVKCIGIAAAPWPGTSTIGNILQQEHIWEFDLHNRRLRFRRSRCTQKSSDRIQRP